MVKFELLKKENDIWYYKYYPEGMEPFGIIGINIKTGDIVMREKAFENCHSEYAYHVVSRIRKEIEEGAAISEKGMVAWY